MMRFVRSELKLNQIDMAERLGLGIKKYRTLERENIYPDTEMLLYLYNISHYQPALFMNMSGRKLQIIKSVGKFHSEPNTKPLETCVFQGVLQKGLMRKMGLEPTRGDPHKNLNLARLPFRHFRTKI